MTCKYLDTCPFYNDKMDDTKSNLANMFKRNYCEDDETKCARFKVAESVGKDKVPVDLYPNMHEKAEKIIQDNN